MVYQGPGVSEAALDAAGGRVHAPGDRATVNDHRGLHRERRTAQRHRSQHPLQISDQAPSLGKIRGSWRQLLLSGRQTKRLPPPKLPVGAHQETQPPRQKRAAAREADRHGTTAREAETVEVPLVAVHAGAAAGAAATASPTAGVGAAIAGPVKAAGALPASRDTGSATRQGQPR